PPPSIASSDGKMALGDKKAEQARLRERTQQIISQLDSIILEYERNGLGGQQVEDLKRTRLLLSNSSLDEMAKILNKLDQAQQAGSESEARAFLMSAYSGQLSVLVQLRDLVNEYNQKRDVSAVPAILQELVQRQQGNLEAGIGLAQHVKAGSALSEIQSASVDSQYEEQRDLSDQFNYVISTIEIIASSGDPESSALYKGALALIQQKRIVGQLSSAREALDQEQVYSAVSFEKNALTAMQELIGYLTPKSPRSERLLELAERLQKAIQEQTLLHRDSVKKVKDLNSMRSLASYQGVILQDVVGIFETARNEAPEAVPDLQQSMMRMRAARSQMPSKDLEKRTEAAGTALQAITSLEQALATLQKDAEKAAQQEKQQQNAEPENQQEALASFAEKLQKLIQWQTALNIQARKREKSGSDLSSLVAEQERIRHSTEFLQKEAWEATPEPAEILGRAARKMEGASNNMAFQGRGALVLNAQDEALELLLLAGRQTASEQADQQAEVADQNAEPAANEEQLAQADASLNQAEQATNDALNELDQGNQAEALDDIADALDALNGADAEPQATNDAGQEAQQAQKAQATNDAAEKGEAGDKTETGEIPGEEMQADAEDKKGEESKDKAIGDLPQQAKDAVAAAEAALDAAKKSLERGNTQSAKAKAEEALDALHGAKKAIAEAKAEAGSGDLVAEIEAQQASGGEQPGEPQEGENTGQPTQPGDMASSESGEGEPSESSEESSDSSDPKGTGKLASDGEKSTTSGEDILGEGEFTGLPAREREAIRQSLAESYPDEYRSMIEQYRRNLASGSR
ncbi:hypothetical protein, partial [Cerasicoccus arenae]